MRIEFVLDTEPHRRPIRARHDENLFFGRLQPLRHSRLNDRSIWQQDHEVKLPKRTLDRVGEANQPKRERALSEIPGFPGLRPVRDKRWS